MTVDIDGDALPPKWPPSVTALAKTDAAYELSAVPLTSVILVSSRVIKVDVDAMVERHLVRSLNGTLASLQQVIEEWAGLSEIPEVDWSKMRSLDFQETLRARDALAKRLQQRACSLCSNFEQHVCCFPSQEWKRLTCSPV